MNMDEQDGQDTGFRRAVGADLRVCPDSVSGAIRGEHIGSPLQLDGKK